MTITSSIVKFIASVRLVISNLYGRITCYSPTLALHNGITTLFTCTALEISTIRGSYKIGSMKLSLSRARTHTCIAHTRYTNNAHLFIYVYVGYEGKYDNTL
ncbi:hypothetical protein Naga_100010g54 [Nannochloropsis gaditana]|uniref:Uncharacterized protein n=1 Tax=Nannochloropsis gaditana TaxID=72520 RepID=W7TME5_9STRA|nr:hypothetical protein Naga_100010g54 [Nannochloropsis gaditana]